MSRCPCDSGLDLGDCCGAIIAGRPAATAEALLRSRYTAFVRGNIDYLTDTLAPEIRGDFDPVEAHATAAEAEWQGLELRAVIDGGEDDETGSVEFIARFRLGKNKRVHHELSRFRREDGRWLCSGGEINPKLPPARSVKVGRNDPCLCGSGKKYKKCCGA